MYEITLTVDRVKEEHVAWTLHALNELSMVLKDGTDVGFVLSVEKDRDGVERFAEFYDPEYEFSETDQRWLVDGVKGRFENEPGHLHR